MKRDYPKVFQHIFSKYRTLILRFGGGGNLKNMDFAKIIFTRFCKYKENDVPFCLNFFSISLTVLEIFHGIIIQIVSAIQTQNDCVNEEFVNSF